MFSKSFVFFYCYIGGPRDIVFTDVTLSCAYIFAFCSRFSPHVSQRCQFCTGMNIFIGLVLCSVINITKIYTGIQWTKYAMVNIRAALRNNEPYTKQYLFVEYCHAVNRLCVQPTHNILTFKKDCGCLSLNMFGVSFDGFIGGYIQIKRKAYVFKCSKLQSIVK